MESAKQQSDILLVEDNRADSTLLQMALLQYCALPYLIHVVNDGEAALKFLHQSAPYATAPRPDLIILDISLPKKDGWEVLAAIRATPVLRTIPVVMLTGVLSAVDEEYRDRLQPTWCVLKPRYLGHYPPLVRTFEAVLRSTEPPTPQSHTEDHVLKRGTPPYRALQARIAAARTETHESIAVSDERMAGTRKALRATHEVFHHLRARREREAEQAPSSYRLPRSTTEDTTIQSEPQLSPDPEHGNSRTAENSPKSTPRPSEKNE